MTTKEKINWWINPFHLIAGWKALVCGLLIMLLSSWLAWEGGIVFDSIFSIHFRSLELNMALAYPLIDLAILGVLMYIAARLFAGPEARLVESVGFMALARSPFLLVGLYAALPGVKESMQDLTTFLLTRDISVLNLPVLIVFLILSIAAIVWFVCLAYNGFKAFSKVRSPKAIPVFAVTLVIAELLAVLFLFSTSYSEIKETIGNIPGAHQNAPVPDVEELSPDSPLFLRAKEAADLFRAGKYEEVHALFDEQMKESISPAQMEELVAGLNKTIGQLTGVDTPFMTQTNGEYEVVFIPLAFEKGKLILQLAFDKDEKIAGMYVKPGIG